jgi:hypothetical protein
VVKKINWPNGHSFAFSVFDDTDKAYLENTAQVYSFLEEKGFRTTKSVWPIQGYGKPLVGGDTCENPEYLAWVKGLQERGFEVGYHLATFHTSERHQTILGLQKFYQYFGHYPKAMATHASCREGIYWGENRLTGIFRLIYHLLTGGKKRNWFLGHVEGNPLFWGDLCRTYITYVRNFVFADINTLKACPIMPYHDPDRPYVNWWFASSEGPDVASFNRTIAEKNQDRLEEEGGACIMYTHFAKGFCQDGALDGRFAFLMDRLARKNGWFVPISTLLDYLGKANGGYVITPGERAGLEAKWLLHKFSIGGSS